jgi:hypothetical protein
MRRRRVAVPRGEPGRDHLRLPVAGPQVLSELHSRRRSRPIATELQSHYELQHCRTVGIFRGHKRTHEVFGVSNTVLPDSYVDRGELDEELRRHLSRTEHIALRGASKCGKSWLRQTVLPEALTVQCRPPWIYTVTR